LKPDVPAGALIDPLRHIGEQLLAADRAADAIAYLRRALAIQRAARQNDPSLRFLLVAAAFFILFLVLLIMSKVIG